MNCRALQRALSGFLVHAARCCQQMHAPGVTEDVLAKGRVQLEVWAGDVACS